MLTDFFGDSLLQNDFKNAFCEIKSISSWHTNGSMPALDLRTPKTWCCSVALEVFPHVALRGVALLKKKARLTE